ncbi:MAG: YfhO family protein [Acidobacteria bacterium]|nr:YfhO family protein [Acidobacteriota bacterium]
MSEVKIPVRRKIISARALATLVIILLPLLYFYPAVKGELALVVGDGWAGYLGIRILTGQSLAQGILPLWNPYIFAGMPLLASVFAGALYPPNWLFALFPPGVAMNLVVITTFHLALAGAYRYARSLGINRTGAIITGVAFTFGGYMVMSMGQTSNIATAAWLPWVLLAIEKLYQRASWRWVTLGAIFIALQFYAGVPQITWYTALLGGAYYLFSVLIRERQQPRWRFSAPVSVMVAGAALLSALQLLPLRELQQQSGRAELSYEYFAAFPFPPLQIVSLIFPYFFGGAYFRPYHIPYWGETGIYVTCGYVGILVILLGCVAVIGPRMRSIVWFWTVTALLSLILSFGDYLPFGLNHLLHRTPVYNLFRASFRHMFEFTFACAVLAGLGVNCISQCDRKQASRMLRISAAIMAIVVLFALLLYIFGSQYLLPNAARPALSNSSRNPEVLVPIFLFVVSVVALWHYAARRTKFSSALLIFVLMVDLVSYGHFLEWRANTFSVARALADPPAVEHIKSRETDLNSFRIMSHASQPFGPNYSALNSPNISIARGLQSVNGYDMLRMRRPATAIGEMTPEGIAQDLNVFDMADQRLNLLNVKYLLFERVGALGTGDAVVYEGVRFRDKPVELKLGPGGRQEMSVGEVMATDLALVSAMSNSTPIADGAPVMKIRLRRKDGQILERELCVGRDTSEWAYDREDVRATIKHQRAQVIESWPVSDQAGVFQGHRYLAKLSFERAAIDKVEMEYVNPSAEITITRASLHDSTNGASTPLDALSPAPGRWQKLAAFGPVNLYQNLKAMPRAWFVTEVETMPEADVLMTIKEGKFRDGRPFDPAQVALLDEESCHGFKVALPRPDIPSSAEASVIRYEPQRIEIRTVASHERFLALSEVYYPGWKARIDGVESLIYRTNYTLRGLVVPSGEHKVEFVYTPASFHIGAICFGLGVLLLLFCSRFVKLKAK